MRCETNMPGEKSNMSICVAIWRGSYIVDVIDAQKVELEENGVLLKITTVEGEIIGVSPHNVIIEY